MTAEQRILAWLERADFTGQGCWHSQDTIARATGCCRRTVIRSIASLEADGRIRVQRFARGSRRPNVYRVRDWNPHKRSGVLNVLGAIREARKAECHTKRTAKPSKGSDPLATPSSLQVVDQSCGRARRKTGFRTCERCGRTIRLQGGRMAEPLKLPVDCDECARKDRIIRQYAENHSKLVEEVSAANEVARTAGKEITRLKGQITKRANEDAEAEDIRTILEAWQKSHPKASIAEGGRRWDVAKKALRLMKDDEQGPKKACLEAIEGLQLRPYQQYEKRYAAAGPGRVKRDDIEHALGDEVRIERCRLIARWHRMLPAQRKWEFYVMAQAISEAYFREAVDELERPAAVPSERRFEVDGIVTRESA